MSETQSAPSDPLDYLNSVGLLDEHEINTELIRHHRALQGMFPYSVIDHPVKALEMPGETAHEYVLQIGDPVRSARLSSEGRSLEVGGPSDYRKLRTIKGEFAPTIITNIKDGVGIHETADARSLHYPNESMATVVAMGLPGLRRRGPDGDLRSAFLHEAYRVLIPEGWVLMHGATQDDLKEALGIGFSVEAGSGCVIAWLTTNERQVGLQTLYTPPRLDMEILLHK